MRIVWDTKSSFLMSDANVCWMKGTCFLTLDETIKKDSMSTLNPKFGRKLVYEASD